MVDVQGDGARAAYNVESLYKDKGAPEALKALQADVLKANGDPKFKPTLQAEFDRLQKDDDKNHVLGRLALEWARPVVEKNTITSVSPVGSATTGMTYEEIKKLEEPKDQSPLTMLTSLMANKLDIQYNDMTSGWKHFFAGTGGITTDDLDRQAVTYDDTRADALKGVEKPPPAPPPAPEPVVKAGQEPGIVRVAEPAPARPPQMGPETPPGGQPRPEQPPAPRPPQQRVPETPPARQPGPEQPPAPRPPQQMRPETPLKPPGTDRQPVPPPRSPDAPEQQELLPRPPQTPGGRPDLYGYGENDNAQAQGPVGEKSVKVPPGGGYWDAAAEMLGYTQAKEGQSLLQRRQELNSTAKPEDMHKIHQLMVDLVNEARQNGKGMLHPGDTITHTFGQAPPIDVHQAQTDDAPPAPAPAQAPPPARRAHNHLRHPSYQRTGHPAPPRQVYYNGRPIEQVNPDEIEYRGDSRE